MGNLIYVLDAHFSVEIEVKTYMTVNGRNISSRQLEVLSAINRLGSKTAAAKELGISPPVVQRYMAQMEDVAETRLMASTPNGTDLTEMGLRLLEISDMMECRCADTREFTISCSPVTEELVMQAVSNTKVKASIIVSDDYTNIRSLKQGMSDMIILDDPQLLSEVDDYEWLDVGYMDMIHVDNGPSYIRYRYGAQRIAYEQLELMGVKYSIDAETYLLSDLMDSNKSFFVDEYLLQRKGLKIKSATDKRLLRHSITAVYRREVKEITRVLRYLQSKHMI